MQPTNDTDCVFPAFPPGPNVCVQFDNTVNGIWRPMLTSVPNELLWQMPAPEGGRKRAARVVGFYWRGPMPVDLEITSILVDGLEQLASRYSVPAEIVFQGWMTPSLATIEKSLLMRTKG